MTQKQYTENLISSTLPSADQRTRGSCQISSLSRCSTTSSPGVCLLATTIMENGALEATLLCSFGTQLAPRRPRSDRSDIQHFCCSLNMCCIFMFYSLVVLSGFETNNRLPSLFVCRFGVLLALSAASTVGLMVKTRSVCYLLLFPPIPLINVRST